MRYGLFLTVNPEIAPPGGETGTLERVGEHAAIGGAVGTAVPIPGVGSTVGTVVGGIVGGVRSLFGGSDRVAASQRAIEWLAPALESAFGAGALQERQMQGARGVEISGRVNIEQMAGFIEEVRQELIRLSCADGGCGRVAAMAEGFVFAPESDAPSKHQGQLIRVTAEQTVSENEQQRSAESSGSVRGSLPAIGGIAAIAAAIFLNS